MTTVSTNVDGRGGDSHKREERWYSLLLLAGQNNAPLPPPPAAGSGSQQVQGQHGEPTRRVRGIVVAGRICGTYTWKQDPKPTPPSLTPKQTAQALIQSINIAERPQSFGLHSPDQLPKTESEFRAIASSFGLHSPDQLPTSEKLHPSYNPRLFCDGGLYLDPDIIGE